MEQKKEDSAASNQQTVLKNTNNYQNEETVHERRLWQMKNIFIAFWLFILFVIIAIFSVGLFDLDINQRVILWTTLCIAYAILLYFLLEPGILREVNRKEFQTIEKEVPVVKEVIRTVDRPVIQEVVKEVPVVKEIEKPVYYQVEKPKLNIPRYDFVGSSLTKIYHKRSCRLGKSIKKKYKESSNDAGFFIKRKYHGCKVCVTKEVKV